MLGKYWLGERKEKEVMKKMIIGLMALVSIQAFAQTEEITNPILMTEKERKEQMIEKFPLMGSQITLQRAEVGHQILDLFEALPSSNDRTDYNREEWAAIGVILYTYSFHYYDPTTMDRDSRLVFHLVFAKNEESIEGECRIDNQKNILLCREKNIKRKLDGLYGSFGYDNKITVFSKSKN